MSIWLRIATRAGDGGRLARDGFAALLVDACCMHVPVEGPTPD